MMSKFLPDFRVYPFQGVSLDVFTCTLTLPCLLVRYSYLKIYIIFYELVFIARNNELFVGKT